MVSVWNSLSCALRERVVCSEARIEFLGEMATVSWWSGSSTLKDRSSNSISNGPHVKVSLGKTLNPKMLKILQLYEWVHV